MKALGYLSLAVACVLYLLLLGVGLPAGARSGDAAGARFMFALLFSLPFLAALGVAAGVATARGGFDWTGVGRGGQHALVLAACVAIAVVTVFAVGLRGEPAHQIPLAMRPLMAWAIFVIPPAALVGVGVCLVTPGATGPWLHTMRGLMTGTAAVSGAALVVLLGEGVAFVQRQQTSRIEETAAFESRRDSMVLATVTDLDPATGFTQLLNFTNQYERPEIRSLALQKVNSRVDFTEALRASLEAGGSGEILTYLAGNEPPDPAAAAPIAAHAILGTAAFIRRQMEQAHTLRNDSFEGPVGRALAAADRLAGHGVDFTPAVRELRRALDTPRTQKIEPPARRTLDAWLAKHGDGAARAR